jgi:preprotein translocase subunit SecD
MLEYARWKYWLVAVVLAVALLFALPNVFGDDYAIQLVQKTKEPVTAAQLATIEQTLKKGGIEYKSAAIENGNVLLRFDTDADQYRARDFIKDEKNGLTQNYINAMQYASRAPVWMRKLGLKPMPLGLDLRGGLYLLYQVDVNGAVEQHLNTITQDFQRALQSASVAYTDINTIRVDADVPDGLRVLLPAGADLGKVRSALNKVHPELACRDATVTGGAAIDCVLTAQQVRERRDFAITSNITTLRNRVNALGVSEPIVQRQGVDRIVVQLPGVQNSAEVKDTLGKVATLEYRLVDPRPLPPSCLTPGGSCRAPVGAKIYDHYEQGQFVGKVMLKRDIIVTGAQLTNATAGTGQNGPEVSVTLNSAGGDEMLRTTRTNLGKPMAVVFIEQRSEAVTRDGKPVIGEDGKPVTKVVKDERVINVATIRGVFANQFQTSGLTMNEARELSLLLRGGALSAPISIANEKTITATLGKENIAKGVNALVIGMATLFAFMMLYYRLFGVIANLVLLANVVVLTALLSSVVPTALTLPGIAGIILTVGMAVDANVLIYERIREEIRNGVSPQAAIKAGFEKAFSAIADSNVTTFIAGVVLFVFGTGAIKGFAIVLSLGILTSMFTALMGSRALLTLIYGGRKKVAALSIG